MIEFESADKTLWNLETKIIDIISAAVNTNDTIVISLRGEGLCLRSCGFYDLLDKISEQFGIDKQRFEIRTANIAEAHDEYTISITNNVWVRHSQSAGLVPEVKNTELATIGCFIGKVNWPRLSIVSWLDHNFPDQSLITCHYQPGSLDPVPLNLLMKEYPEGIEIAGSFLKSCPRQLNNYSLPYQERKLRPDFKYENILKLDFSNVYSRFFAEIVCETYFSGLTFFPTEKTFRPMLQLTPFITFGPHGHLGNLRRCGFRTFNDYWDESYDDLQDRDRLLAIQEVSTQLFKLSQAELQDMYTDMQPILKHNAKRVMEITGRDLQFDHQK